MSKILKGLDSASHEKSLRTGFFKASEIQRGRPIRSMKEGQVKNSMFIWIFLIGIIITVLVVFNMKKGQDTVALTEIFPEEEVMPIDVEYEFVDKEAQVKRIIEDEPKKAAAPVKTEPVKTSAPAAAEPVKTAVESVSKIETYTIQVASFKDEERAEAKAKELIGKSFPAFTMAKDLGDKGTWYRVYVGKFDSKADADEYLKKVQADYKDSFVIAPKK